MSDRGVQDDQIPAIDIIQQPGQGPSKAARDAGFYDILLIGAEPR